MIKKCLRLIMTKQINYFTTKCKYVMLKQGTVKSFFSTLSAECTDPLFFSSFIKECSFGKSHSTRKVNTTD